MYELRTVVMILVEVSCKDHSGIMQTVSARMEDKSAGGACIRLKTEVGVGSRLKIQSQWEHFSGIAKYCRSEGREYVVGIQRDVAATSKLTPEGAGMTTNPQVMAVTRSESQPNWHRTPPGKERDEGPARPVANVSAHGPRNTAALPPRGFTSQAGKKAVTKYKQRVPPSKEPEALRRTDLQTKPPPRKKAEVGKAWKLMGRKWLDLKLWHGKPESAGASGGKGVDTSAGESNERGHEMANRVSSTADYTMAAEVVPRPAVELLPMEDICRSAGIMSPPKDYGINKVVEMINSEHVRGLSKELKRAAVLMALNAAGIPVGQVLQDYKSRQEALDVYEAAQKKQAESEWARRAEEVVQIQAETERVKEQFMARIKRSLEGVAREKATFNAWQTLKQQETQNMSEAAELCSRSGAPESAKEALPEAASPTIVRAPGSDAVSGLAADSSLAKAAGANS